MKNFLHILGIVLLIGEAIWMFWPDDEPAPDPFEVQFEQLQKEYNPCANLSTIALDFNTPVVPGHGPGKAFSALFYRETLSLKDRNITHFKLNTLQRPAQSQCIKEIDLSGNALQRFPDGAMVITGLKRINLRQNDLHSLDLALDPVAYRNIEHLYLNENPMVELGSEITAFSHLEWLDLRDMPNLERISDDIQQLQHLKYLQVSGTPLAKSYGAVTKLRRLLPNTQVHWATPKQ